MFNNCSVESIVYQATVSTNDNKPPESYVRLNENYFKTRYANHKSSFNLYEKRNSTELSKHIWELKRNNIDFTIKWILPLPSPINIGISEITTNVESTKSHSDAHAIIGGHLNRYVAFSPGVNNPADLVPSLRANARNRDFRW